MSLTVREEGPEFLNVNNTMLSAVGKKSPSNFEGLFEN
jgi:hypothetical protein